MISSIPSFSLLESGSLPIEDLAHRAIREGHRPAPIYGMHRWFARRSSAVFRALLTAAVLDATEANAFWQNFNGDLSLPDFAILDPFAGGGTSLVEAAHAGAQVIGYDIDPIAVFITRFELRSPCIHLDREKIDTILHPLAELLRPFHLTTDNLGEECTVIHHFWVEVLRCPHCGEMIPLHPHHRLAYDRKIQVQWVFCSSCGEIEQIPFDDHLHYCECGATTNIGQGAYGGRKKCICPGCHSSFDLLDVRGPDPVPPQWQLFAQEYLDGEGHRRFKPATEDDLERYVNAGERLTQIERICGPFAPDRKIPAEQRADRRPLIHGFNRYRDLFNKRQLLHLTLLGRAIRSIDDADLREALSVAYSEHLSTNCMYTAYAFGYRRQSPIFSVHAYRHITRPVEINPWLLGIGRGTFPNAVRKVYKGIESVRDRQPSGFEVIVGSAENISGMLPGSIDLILTDPPYFDNISYSEYSDFYLAWHQSLGCALPPYDEPSRHAPIAENLAVRKRTPQAIIEYSKRLTDVFLHCRRILKQTGLFVFTYHHRSPQAWYSIAQALLQSGFTCNGVLPLRGEGNGGLHSFTGSIKWDAVLVCRPLGQPRPLSGIDISSDAITRARNITDFYSHRFASHQEIGFFDPDKENLYRACLCAEASRWNGDADPISLYDSLNSSWEVKINATP